MNENSFLSALLAAFRYSPTPSQYSALQLITHFLLNRNLSENLFLLKGFAGTGKTSITKALIACLPLVQHQAVLLAPTGRAAKVMASVAKKQSFTIHKFIYYHKSNANDEAMRLRPNKFQRTLFIVDEASMISNSGGAFQNALLDDLMRFVYSGKDCSLLFIGDVAQLPPVGTHLSPALNADYLTYHYQKQVIETELTDVVRQRRKSGILRNATRLRKKVLSGTFSAPFLFRLSSGADLQWLTNGEEVQDALFEAYQEYGADETAVIVRSNKRAVGWNNQIRHSILDIEDEIAAGDLLMVVKNNYFWSKDFPQLNFIANGDTLEVLHLYAFREYYGFRFAEALVQLIDYPELSPFDTVILLDTLRSEAPALTPAQSQMLYEEVLADYQDEPTASAQYQKVKENPFYNALQVKFSYAITCHKSQGGQWEAVFVEKPYLPDDYVIDESYYRWLYTALTRAKRKAYLIGFPQEDFE